VNNFKCQINYVAAIKELLNCYHRLEKFNAISCVKYHKHPLFFLFIRANRVTSPTNSNDATKLFSRKCQGMFQQDGTRAHTSKATIT